MTLKKPVTAGLALVLALLAFGLWRWQAAPESAAAAGSAADGPAALTLPWMSGAASDAATEATAVQALAASAPALAALPAPAALRALKQCYYADSCGGSPNDTLSTHFAVAQAISERLDALPAQGGNTAELGALAREFLGFPDGHVQASALALAARLPADTATVNAAVSALNDSYDQLLFRKAMPVLQQWQAQGLSSGMDDMLAGTLHTGGLHAAQVVAEHLTPFLNDANFSRYEALAQQLQPGARQAALQQSLKEYRLRKSGG